MSYSEQSLATSSVTELSQSIVRRIVGKLRTNGNYESYAEYQSNELVPVRMRTVTGKLALYPAVSVTYPEDTPDYPRLSLDEIIAVVRQLPDIRLINSVFITDNVDQDEAWLRAHSNKPQPSDKLLIPARAKTNGELMIYRPQLVSDLVTNLRNEWCFLLFINSVEAARAFDAVGDFEGLPDGSEPSQTSAALWCYLGERILQDEAGVPIFSADFCPIRFAILAKAMFEKLQTVPAELRCDRHDDIVNLCIYLRDRIAQQAALNLNKQMEQPDEDRINRVSTIFGYLLGTTLSTS